MLILLLLFYASITFSSKSILCWSSGLWSTFFLFELLFLKLFIVLTGTKSYLLYNLLLMNLTLIIFNCTSFLFKVCLLFSFCELDLLKLLLKSLLFFLYILKLTKLLLVLNVLLIFSIRFTANNLHLSLSDLPSKLLLLFSVLVCVIFILLMPFPFVQFKSFVCLNNSSLKFQVFILSHSNSTSRFIGSKLFWVF